MTQATPSGNQTYAASGASSIGSTSAASSFSGLLTRVETGHMRIGSAGNGRGFRDTVSALLKRFRLREERKPEAAE